MVALTQVDCAEAMAAMAGCEDPDSGDGAPFKVAGVKFLPHGMAGAAFHATAAGREVGLACHRVASSTSATIVVVYSCVVPCIAPPLV